MLFARFKTRNFHSTISPLRRKQRQVQARHADEEAPRVVRVDLPPVQVRQEPRPAGLLGRRPGPRRVLLRRGRDRKAEVPGHRRGKRGVHAPGGLRAARERGGDGRPRGAEWPDAVPGRVRREGVQEDGRRRGRRRGGRGKEGAGRGEDALRLPLRDSPGDPRGVHAHLLLRRRRELYIWLVSIFFIFP